MSQSLKNILTSLFILTILLFTSESRAGCIEPPPPFEVNDDNEFTVIRASFSYGVFYDGSLNDFESELSDGMFELEFASVYSYQNIEVIFSEILPGLPKSVYDSLYIGLVQELNDIAHGLGAVVWDYDYLAEGFDASPIIPGCDDIFSCNIIIPFHSDTFEYTLAYSVSFDESPENRVTVVELAPDFSTQNTPDMVMMLWSEGFSPPQGICVTEPSTVLILMIALTAIIHRNKRLKKSFA